MSIARPAELHVPIELPPDGLAAAIGSWRDPALLESAAGFGAAGRWSLLAAEPRWRFESTADGWKIVGNAGAETAGDDDPLDRLADLLRLHGLAEPGDRVEDDGPPFRGGLIGAFGYDLAPRLEVLPRKAVPDSRIPDVVFGLYDTAVVVDNQAGTATLSAFDVLKEGTNALMRRVDCWRRRLDAAARPVASSRIETAVAANVRREDYLGAVRRALEYIRAGDIFQVNLSQRFEARGQVVPLDLYLRAKAISPAPYAAYLAWDDLAVISASPESFYQTRGDRIVTRPIKGTRPRGEGPDEDAALREELRQSAKDRAELTMIVDLERNDLGRVCRFGTVRVTDPHGIESFAQVHHLVATVEGRLRPGVGPIDVVRAVFPGGSITGAPKIRAMQIIDELEPTRRGLYTGAIGYFSRGGTSGFNIAIRTLLAEGDHVSYQVGGGIVADSDPEAEYHETLHKGRGLRAVLEGARP